jgi:CheY-like chemotaxis protein
VPLPGFIRINPSQLDQVLANLCVNARDAIGGVGKVTIRTQVHSFDDTEYFGVSSGTYVELSVADTGCGMSEEILGHIFEPFFTTKEAARGTGLGLSIVHGIIKQNGGHITVYSEPGCGSTFRVYLPRCCKESPVAREEAALEPGRGRGQKILLVEDEASVRYLVRTMLKKLGYSVLEADSPEAAIRIASKPDFDSQLLLTDVILPGMNGGDLADRLKEMHPHLRFLFISGYTADALVRNGTVRDGALFLPKPFTRLELGEKVRQALEG